LNGALSAVAERPCARDSAEGAQVVARLRAAIPEIQGRAPTYDAHGAFPAQDVETLRRVGALRLFGEGRATPLELMEALRLTGRANLSLGRIFEGHVNGAALVSWYGSDEQRAELAQALADGLTFGVWNTEPAPGVRVTPDANGSPQLAGRKSYATGAGHIDRAIITARLALGGRQMFLVDARDPDRADPAEWRVRGMRATVSGAYDLTGLSAEAVAQLGAPGDYEREPRFSAGAWRFTAVQLGGVERVLELLRGHLVDAPAGKDPIHRARFGEALRGVRSAYLWVREAAQRAEAPEAGPAEVAFVLMTRGVVEQAGLAVMEAAARSVGTRAFFEDHPLDQACRDLALYLRQPVPDLALDRAAGAFLEADCWRDDPLW
jgi:hypothetical protein